MTRREVDRRGDHDHVHVGGVDDLLHLVELPLGVPHGRQDRADVVLAERLVDRADGPRTRIHDLGRAVLAGRHHAGAVLHLAVRERGAVLDHQHPLARDRVGSSTVTRLFARTTVAVGLIEAIVASSSAICSAWRSPPC